MAGPKVRQRATLLSDVTHINKDGPALRHPAGTIRNKTIPIYWAGTFWNAATAVPAVSLTQAAIGDFE